MPIINQRWPSDLCPNSCEFGRTRNDVVQSSARTGKTSVIRQGRPLWRAECTWTLPNTRRLAKLRYWLDQLEGFNGSVQIWDFAQPYPFGVELATGANGLGEVRTLWSHGGGSAAWADGSALLNWTSDANITTNAAFNAGATAVSITGLQPNKLAVVQGQYVQIGRRLYLSASTVTANGAGSAAIDLTYPLLASVASGATVRLAFAACEMRLADQNYGQRSRAGDGLTTITATFIESVEDV